MKKTDRKVGNVPVFVTSITPDSKQPKGDIVLVHMSWGASWAFRFHMPFLAEAGYVVHALDLRGHGKSGGTVAGATMRDYVDDVHTVVQKLGIKSPIVIGHSMGGLVALMYSANHPVRATVAMDSSSPSEVQKTSEEKTYPEVYRPEDAGMPKNPMKAMQALSDIPMMRMVMMKMMLGVESGVARSERKKGISVPKESLKAPVLFIGAERGTSLPFGIGIELVRAQAAYYGAPVVEIQGATHPGLLIGKHWEKTVEATVRWLETA